LPPCSVPTEYSEGLRRDGESLGHFQRLDVWQLAHELALAVYRITVNFPRNELYSLTSQMRRSAISICANLAEGAGRRGDPEFRRFIRISLGSASELECYFLLAKDLGHLDQATFADFDGRVHTIQGKLVTLLRALQR
jgi:four helix bundle protein